MRAKADEGCDLSLLIGRRQAARCRATRSRALLFGALGKIVGGRTAPAVCDALVRWRYSLSRDRDILSRICDWCGWG